jgi:putative DNA primase/helicase
VAKIPLTNATARKIADDYLRARGLSLKEAEAMGWSVVLNAKAEGYGKVPLPGIVIPFEDTWTVRFLPGHEPKAKGKDKNLKFIGETGALPRLYFPANYDWDEYWKAEDRPTLRLTEGPVKAAAATKKGIPTAALAGKDNFRSDKRGIALISDLVSLPIKEDERIDLVPDSDWKTNPDVLASWEECGRRLRTTRKVDPYLVLIVAKGEEKVGLDDLLTQKDGLKQFERFTADAAPIRSDLDDSDQSLLSSFIATNPSVRYFEDDGSWWEYRGGLWVESLNGPAYPVGEYLKSLSPGPGKPKTAQYALHRRLNSAGAVKAVVTLAQSNPALADRMTNYDREPWLLGVPGGDVLDLRTGSLRAGTREDRMTKMLPVRPGGKCPVFLEYLKTAQPDAQVRAYLKRLFGYFLTAETREQIVPFFIGCGGSGKSTAVRCLRNVLGPGAYFATMPLHLLLEDSSAEKKQTALWPLIGGRLAAITEIPDNRPFSSEVLKQLSGSDSATARRLFHDAVTFTPQFKPLIVANQAPRLSRVDDAIIQRIHVVKFDVRFRGTDHEDKKLGEKLDAEAGGILAWMVEGCLEWQKSGLSAPKAVRLASEAMIAEADVMGNWIDEGDIVLSEGEFAPSNGMFDRWKQYCESTNNKGQIGSLQTFCSRLENRFQEKIERARGYNAALKRQERGYNGLLFAPAIGMKGQGR